MLHINDSFTDLSRHTASQPIQCYGTPDIFIMPNDRPSAVGGVVSRNFFNAAIDYPT